MIGALAAGAFLLALSLWMARRARRNALSRLRAAWGRPLDRERDMEAIADGPARLPGLDDRTWNDLLLDDVFAAIDRTASSIGQQALYARLRTVPLPPHRDEFEALAGRFERDPTARARAQLSLAALSDPAAYRIRRLCGPGALDRRTWHAIFPIVAAAMIAAVLLAFARPAYLLVVIVGLGVNLVLRASTARRVGAEIAAFRQIGPLLAAGAVLAELDGPETTAITGALAGDLRMLRRVRMIARWVSRDPLRSGDLFMSAMEYLNLLFLVDANALYFASRDLERHGAALARVIETAGTIDAAISVASWRTGLGPRGWTRPTLLDPGAPARFDDVRHPLLADAVPNSVLLAPPRGILITGSNMSGKSTFLRTVAVNVVLAQTLNTCLASRYEAPSYAIRSCIGITDDLLAGKSYYLVEVETVLSMVAASERTAPHLFLFDELFRGTNAVERIAAAEAVLLALVAGGRPHVVLAATHDGELVDLLRDHYEVCHFGDRLGPDGLAFDYQMRMGPATSRNAIALLRHGGAPAALVERAIARAESLDRARRAGI